MPSQYPTCRHFPPALGTVVLAAPCLLLLVSLPGCSGCRFQRPAALDPETRRAELEKRKKEEQKPDFEPARLTILPANMIRLDEPQDEDPYAAARVAAKPGHWTSTLQQLKANNFDFHGELSLGCVDRHLNSMSLERSRFSVISIRPASLPKGQAKQLEVPLYVPLPQQPEARIFQVATRLRSRLNPRPFDLGIQPAVMLRPNQFYFIVLAREPDRYGFLNHTTTVAPPSVDLEFNGIQADYIVSAPDVAQELPLPGTALAWTSIAYMIWDDVEPDRLTPDQKTALVDWLHWGGRLVVSGPKSLDRLRHTFLEPFLPVVAGPMTIAEPSAFDALNNHWAIVPKYSRRSKDSYPLAPPPDQPLEVIELRLTVRGRFVPDTGDLVAEAGVGRGNVVVTAFALTDRRLVNWPSFDSFLNGCLLGRPPRRFQRREGFASVQWADRQLQPGDARLASGLRYLIRDAAFPEHGRRGTSGPPGVISPLDVGDRGRWQFDRIGPANGYRHDDVSGVAGWSDFSSAAVAARAALRRAAGISVPDKTFVAGILAVYLVCLVPLNWLLFRLAGRIEWAWFAAPAIAVAGAIAVIRLAQLDIGFVRSRTELAVLELQPDYRRAHLTRFSGLYSSLTTTYRLTLDDPFALILPFSTDPAANQQRLQRRQEVEYRRDQEAGLAGFPVLSNSTGMIRAEQMVDLGGAFQWYEDKNGGFQLTNATRLSLDGAVVIHRLDSRCRLAVLTDIRSRATRPARFDQPGDDAALFGLLEQQGFTAADLEGGEVSLRELVRLASDPRQLGEGDYRLVGWCTTEVPGMAVRPRSNQELFRTLVVVNLRYGAAAQRRPDENLLEEVQSIPAPDLDLGALTEPSSPSAGERAG